jgi:uncharacterized phosphosugar-binding protein
MTAKHYLAEVMRLVERLGTDSYGSIVLAGQAVASSLTDGHRIWVTPTTYCLHEESTGRAGGFIAVHVLTDAASVLPGDCILVGSPVGTSDRPITLALECRRRGGRVIALTNVEFEDDPRTLLEHPSRKRLHEVADIVIDVPGPLGDGIFEVEELALRAIPHSGITGMTAMWMVFSEALSVMRAGGVTPRLYECVNIDGARERNEVQLAGYLESGLGFLADGEAGRVVAARAP